MGIEVPDHFTAEQCHAGMAECKFHIRWSVALAVVLFGVLMYLGLFQ